MLVWLYRLFIVGFPPACDHKFDKWKIVKSGSNSYGLLKVHQGRECSVCGLTEFKVDTTG